MTTTKCNYIGLFIYSQSALSSSSHTRETCVEGTWLQDWHLPRHQGWTYRAPVRKDKNLECLSLCWHVPLRRDHPGYSTAEVGNHIYIYIYIYIFIYIYLYIHTHTYIYVYIFVTVLLNLRAKQSGFFTIIFGSRICSVGIRLGYSLDNTNFKFLWEQKIFLFSKKCRLSLEPN